METIGTQISRRVALIGNHGDQHERRGDRARLQGLLRDQGDRPGCLVGPIHAGSAVLLLPSRWGLARRTRAPLLRDGAKLSRLNGSLTQYCPTRSLPALQRGTRFHPSYRRHRARNNQRVLAIASQLYPKPFRCGHHVLSDSAPVPPTDQRQNLLSFCLNDLRGTTARSSLQSRASASGI